MLLKLFIDECVLSLTRFNRVKNKITLGTHLHHKLKSGNKTQT